MRTKAKMVRTRHDQVSPDDWAPTTEVIDVVIDWGDYDPLDKRNELDIQWATAKGMIANDSNLTLGQRP